MRSLVCFLVGLIVLGTLGVTLASATQNPTPFVNQPLIPASVAPGGAGFTLTVNGTGFVSGSVVNWNGSARATTFVSGSQLNASILSSDIATANTGSVTVSSPTPGGGVSNVVFLPVRVAEASVSFGLLEFGTAQDPQTFVIADFNKDGNQDIAMAAPGGQHQVVQVLLGKGNGRFTQGAAYDVVAENPLSTDVNNDGNPDLVFASTDLAGFPSLGVMLGNGDGSFQPPTYYRGPICCQSVAGDFNGDGAIDIVTADGDQYCIFPGNGDGTFKPPACYSLPSANNFTLTTGSFDADNNLDLAFADEQSGGVTIVLGNGDGTFRTAETYPVDGTSVWVTNADFNGDGKSDLAVVNATNDSIEIFLGNGDGTFQSPSAFATVDQPSAVAVSELNGDGKLDLIVAGGLSGNVDTVAVLLGNGDGKFQSQVEYSGPLPGFLGVADFDNDGRADVAVADVSFSTISLLMQGYVVVSPTQMKFPLQLVNTVSNPQIVTLTNTGSFGLKIFDMGIIGSNFSQLNDCKTVSAGGSCNVAIYFTPTAVGDLTAQLNVDFNGRGTPATVNLSGVATTVSLQPSSLNFGNRNVGSYSKPQTVTLTDQGTVAINISKIGIGGVNSTDFLQVNACPSKLMPGASCNITVYFHPTARGLRKAILGVEDDGGGSPQKVPLTGTGT